MIERDDLTAEDTRGLIALHLAEMHAHSPPGSVFALDASGLGGPEVSLWTARIDFEAVGMIALKVLGDDAGEIKSMRVRSDRLRQGIGAALLETVVAEARRRGYRRLSLETGAGPSFAASHHRGVDARAGPPGVEGISDQSAVRCRLPETLRPRA